MMELIKSKMDSIKIIVEMWNPIASTKGKCYRASCWLTTTAHEEEGQKHQGQRQSQQQSDEAPAYIPASYNSIE